MRPSIVRPSVTDEQRDRLRDYLSTQWKRAVDARSGQVDDDYNRWNKNYEGIPREKTRTVPWYNSSNFVVKLIRTFVDTFVARTLNIIFATQPIYFVEGFPREVKEALEAYLTRKALHEWDVYSLGRDTMMRGSKTGTAAFKGIWDLETKTMVSQDLGRVEELEVTLFEGPRVKCIPFEDFYIYPITCNCLTEAEVLFHKLRYVEEKAKRMIEGDDPKWIMTSEQLDQALKQANDIKKTEQQQEAQVIDSWTKELQVIECHLKWSLDGEKIYDFVALYQPEINQVIDVFHDPYLETFKDYRPFPREDFYYGESMCQILEQSQEEVSQIHNDRRNSSFLSSAPVFKRRLGSLLPNPSTNWYPGKVFDLESMEDFEAVSIGRNYVDMMQEETHVIQLAERLSGIGPPSQGYAQGMMGKRGIYNASGTLALLSESNQRQDTSIKDVRLALGRIAKMQLWMQRTFGHDDPTISTFPEEMQVQIRAALKLADPARLRAASLEVKISTAAANKDVQRANLMQLAQILSQYGGFVQQSSVQLANPQLNPSLRLIMNDLIKMQRWMATRLLRAYDEHDAEGVLPDVTAAIERSIPGGGSGTKGPEPGVDQGGMEPRGANGAPAIPDRENLQAFLQMAQPLPGASGPGGMAS